ncbi:unnamed protein product [Acanthosepion pharaonis]|uniref:Uncharacterized protein n=1 Tax=Acanthosepion pharaonis TaxID=158019 RepID=A0A812BXI3_ACAPH|nr:unnamed protein product [Sepia pharaonis]
MTRLGLGEIRCRKEDLAVKKGWLETPSKAYRIQFYSTGEDVGRGLHLFCHSLLSLFLILSYIFALSFFLFFLFAKISPSFNKFSAFLFLSSFLFSFFLSFFLSSFLYLFIHLFICLCRNILLNSCLIVRFFLSFKNYVSFYRSPLWQFSFRFYVPFFIAFFHFFFIFHYSIFLRFFPFFSISFTFIFLFFSFILSFLHNFSSLSLTTFFILFLVPSLFLLLLFTLCNFVLSFLYLSFPFFCVRSFFLSFFLSFLLSFLFFFLFFSFFQSETNKKCERKCYDALDRIPRLFYSALHSTALCPSQLMVYSSSLRSKYKLS